MGYYYIATTDGDYFELDSTTEISVSNTGRVAEFPLEDGESAGDHYVNEPTTVTFSGRISDVKSSRTGFITKSTQDYINGLLNHKRNKIPFTVYYSRDLPPLGNCLFESLVISQDQTNGTRNEISTYRISFTAKQLRFVQAAQETTVPKQDVDRYFRDKEDSPDAVQDTTDEETDKVEEELGSENREDQIAEIRRRIEERRGRSVEVVN